MAIPNTGGADVEIVVGGKFSTGPGKGVYHIKVGDVGKDLSKGDEAKGKAKRPFLSLSLVVTNKDKLHTSKHGKKLTTDRTYFAAPGDDAEKVETMMGMAKQKLYDGFGLTWPKDSKKIDIRLFAGKEAYVWLDHGKPDENGQTRVEVKAYAVEVDKLPKAAREWLEAAKSNKKVDAEA
jgi:hypothetical protein